MAKKAADKSSKSQSANVRTGRDRAADGARPKRPVKSTTRALAKAKKAVSPRAGKKLAKIKSTGGFGFSFEDKIAAGFFCKMLDGGEVLEISGAQLQQMSFQVAASGWKLDDLLLELRIDQDLLHCGVSVKSPAYLTAAGFKEDFLAEAWAQWAGGSPFNPELDYLALAVGHMADSVSVAWEDIERRSISGAPEHLAAQLTSKGSSSALERAIFKSITNAQPKLKSSSVEAARFLKHLRVRHFGMTADATGINECLALLSIEDRVVAKDLWEELQQIASTLRTVGGTISVESLLQKLRNKYQLKAHPNYRGAWQEANRVSQSNCKAVHSVAGVDTSIAFAKSDLSKVMHVPTRQVLGIVGDSGLGKSSLVKSYVESVFEDVNLLWLSPQDLDKPNQALVSSSLRFNLEIPELVRYSPKPVVFVLDAAEQFSPLAMQRVSEIVAAMCTSRDLDFQVILTTQPASWARIRSEATVWGTNAIDELLFSGVPFDNVLAALAKDEVALSLLVRPELRRVFTNLATLDQVLRVTAVDALTPSKGWIGETEIIDWIWNYWSGTDALQYQREALLQMLGNEDALHGPGIPLAKIGFEVKGVLGDPRIRSMLNTSTQGVRFVHEVIGDWARYESLKGHGEERHGKILSYIKNPRWMRAIRLYSQSLLEQEQGLPVWEKEFGAFGTGDSDNQIAADVFSDSLLLATNSLELLKRMWPSLIADEAVRLKRILKRILVVGTISVPPTKDLGDEFAEALEILMRLPIPAYWDGLLEVLSQNTHDVVERCIEEAGEICSFYLRVVPPGLGRRDLVARLAVALGQKAKESEHSYGYGVSKTVYEAVLRAAQELPDEVADLALTFAERKSAIEHSVTTTKIVRSTGLSSRLFGRLRKPWRDGPKRRVDENFREAVLAGDALRSLMSSRPSVAQEVILAVCIEEPQLQNEYESQTRLDDSGFAFQSKHMPAMYFTGPWLLFLRTNTAYALATILSITDFATDRWLEGFQTAHRASEVPAYRLYFSDGHKDFIGDGNVYNWYRYMRGSAVFVESALMALEKWLYDKIDSKEDVTADTNRILQGSKSAAVVGLLVAVGLYEMSLFKGALLPLLSNADVFGTQRSTIMDSSWKIMFDVTWGRYGAQIAKEVKTWNEMPHRRHNLYEVARWYVVSDPEVESHIAKFRKRWEEEAERFRGEDGSLPATTELFLAQLSKDNYTMRDAGNGQVAIEFRANDQLQARLDGERARPELNLACFGLIAQARQSIDEGKFLSAAEAATAYSQLQRIASSTSTDETFLIYRRDAVAAGIALMLTSSNGFAGSGSEPEKFCTEQMLKLANEEPTRGDFDSPDSVADDADLFLSETALVLIRRGATAPEVWRVLLRGIFAYHYQTTEKIVRSVYTHRSDACVRFTELATSLFLWAVVRGPASAQSHRDDPTVLRPYQEMMTARFLRGHFGSRHYSATYLLRLNHKFAKHILSGTPNWEWHEQRVKLLATNPRIVGSRNRLRRLETYIDLEVLCHGFNFLGLFEGLRAVDAPALRDFFQLLLDLEMTMLPNSPEADSDEFENQYGFDDWLMPVASIYYTTLPISEAVSTVASPIMSLGAGAHYWIADFLKAFFRYAPTLCPTAEDLAERWRALINFAAGSPRWDFENVKLRYYLEQLYRDLFGMSGHPSYAADKGLSSALLLLRKELYEWCERWLKDPDFAAAFARFLSAVGGVDILSLGLLRLAAALPELRSHRSRNGDLDDALLAAVQHIWKVETALVRTPGAVSESFRSVVSDLTARLNPSAIDLQAKIAEG